MNLDDLERLRAIDSQNLLAQIDQMPDILWAAWDRGLQLKLPDSRKIERVVLAGMGQAGLAADLLAAYGAVTCPLPLITHHNYDLPAAANGEKCLTILLSADESSEEAQSWIAAAVSRSCPVLVIAPNGAFAAQARAAGAIIWEIETANALAWCFGLLLACAVRLGLLPDQADVLREAVDAMRIEQIALALETPVARNLAKRDAGQLMGRSVVIVAADLLAPVARHWKNQINLLAHNWAQVEILPDADANTLEGILQPESVFERMMVLFLQAEAYHPRNTFRADLTRHGFMMAGLNTDTYAARGRAPLTQICTALQFGEYLAYYLALAGALNPSDRAISESFQRALGG